MASNTTAYEWMRLRAQDVKKAEKVLEEAVYAAYPIGTRAFWNHGKGLARVEVVRHGYGGSVVIRNIRTGKERRVDGHDSRLRQ